MTPDERQAMRALITSALRRATLPGVPATAPGGYVRGDAPPVDLLERFRTELTSLGGVVHELPDADAAAIAGRIDALVGEAPKRALAWRDDTFPVPGLAAALIARGFVVVHQATADDDRGELAGCSVGVTAVDALLAETGSVVLVSGPGRGRLASLLPPIHVAIATREQLVHSLPDLLLARPELATRGSNLVCITGPSRTADIEHTLSRGVHGPGEVHVVVI